MYALPWLTCSDCVLGPVLIVFFSKDVGRFEGDVVRLVLGVDAFPPLGSGGWARVAVFGRWGAPGRNETSSQCQERSEHICLACILDTQTYNSSSLTDSDISFEEEEEEEIIIIKQCMYLSG